ERAPPVAAPDEALALRREGNALHVRLDGQLHALLHLARRLPSGRGRRAPQLGEGRGVGLNLRERLSQIGVDDERLPNAYRHGVGVIRAEMQRADLSGGWRGLSPSTWRLFPLALLLLVGIGGRRRYGRSPWRFLRQAAHYSRRRLRRHWWLWRWWL